MNNDTNVTVVGAGPVGLALAAELALAGVSVQVLERQAEPERAMKAQSITMTTAEALDRRGLLAAAERIQRETLGRSGPVVAGKSPSDTRFTGHFAGMAVDADLVNWDDPDFVAHTAAAGARVVPQPELVALLTEHVTRLGVPIHRGVEVTSFEDTGDGVIVGANHGSVRTDWLVGCDGGHSAVRRLAGIEFPGEDPEITGIQAVVEVAGSLALTNGWTWTPRGTYRYGPQPGRVAIVEFDHPPADRKSEITLEEVQTRLRRVTGADITVTALHGAPTRWTDNTRQAANYRAGRVLLAGDAAHVHPPFGGQGLNLGYGDAMNLGWKLAAVIAGWAPEGLLDTYDAERRPIGEWVLAWTRGQIGVLRGDAKSGALREIVSDLLSTRDGATYAVKHLSGVVQRIDLPGDHPLIGRQVPDLWLSDGSRLVDHGHGGGFLLLDRTSDGAFACIAKAWDGRVTVVADEPASPAGVLVRPDGVVAWAVDSADAAGLEDTLRRWAGEAKAVRAGECR
ncbi:FAD-dependent oxidoreductase [Kutzneria sp. NPDC052558]|uniref:FAD-dependent oxidoreductase n=1 Tax=Kutzneria sp. NPDC052558 TaxID=3364121 RepID=UPI0037C986B2